jgi:4-amino-4-deoxy-L-arabinose transferase-like glycosyltransferase
MLSEGLLGYYAGLPVTPFLPALVCLMRGLSREEWDGRQSQRTISLTVVWNGVLLVRRLSLIDRRHSTVH